MNNVIINTKKLKELMENNPLAAVIDLRSEEDYQSGHIDGAVNIPAKENFGGVASFLPELEALGDKLGELGITNESEIILYDSGKYRAASKAFFVLYYLNHHSVSILEGGLSEWVRLDNELTNELPTITQATYIIDPVESRAVSIDYVKENLENSKSTLIDSRSVERYTGQREPKYAKAGRIPNTVNYVSNEVFDEAGKWRSNEELKKHYEALENKDEVIVSCGSGTSACLNLVALKIAGYDNVKMYSGGFSEWINEGNEIDKD